MKDDAAQRIFPERIHRRERVRKETDPPAAHQYREDGVREYRRHEL